MTKIYRNTIQLEEIEIPEGYKVCHACKGKGLVSKYDQGWRSVVHSAELAALRECIFCGGAGYQLDEKSD